MSEDCFAVLDDIVTSNKPDGLENFDVAVQKYKASVVLPISWKCNICGETISNTQDWLLHHFTEWHRRVLKWIDAFRARCIDRQDEEGTTTFVEAIGAVQDKVLYTQELFETNGKLVCCVCACDVNDVAEHLASMKHNEIVLSIVDSSAFTKIKECRLTSDNGVCEEFYHKDILRRLADELPPTADAPLEVVVLKHDLDFSNWFENYRQSVAAVIEAKGMESKPTENVDSSSQDVPVPTASTGCSIANEPSSAGNEDKDQDIIFVEEIKAPSGEGSTLLKRATAVRGEKTDNAAGSNCCTVCDMKYFSREMFLKHCRTEDHAKKSTVFDFINSSGLFVIGEEPATAQGKIDAKLGRKLGLHEVYEMYHLSTETRFWICGICFCGFASADSLYSHLHGVKHEKRYIESWYPDMKERITTKEQLSTWLFRVGGEISRLEGKRSLKHAVIVSDVPDLLKACGLEDAVLALEKKASNPSVLDTDQHDQLIDLASSDLILADTGAGQKCLLEQATPASSGGDQTTAAELVTLEKPTESVPPPTAAAVVPDDGHSTAAATGDETLPVADSSCSGVEVLDEQQQQGLKKIAMDDANVALQCEACWDILIVKKSEMARKWLQHMESADHKKKIRIRSQWKFDPKLFTKRFPSHHVVTALEQARKSCSLLVIAGLSDLVEIYRVGGKTDAVEVICRTCAENMGNAKVFQSHMSSKNHLMKYMNRYYPADAVKVFKGFAEANFFEICRFLTKKRISAGVIQVYESKEKPAKAKPVDKTDKKRAATGKSNPTKSNVPVKSSSVAASSKTNSPAKPPATKPKADVDKKPLSTATTTSVKEKRKPEPESKQKGASPTKSLAKSAKKSEPTAKPKSDDVPRMPSQSSPVKPPVETGKSLVDAISRKLAKGTTEKKSDNGVAKANTSSSKDDDVALKLLMDSPSATIPIRYHAFAQPILDQCTDPLVGIEEMHEYCSRDISYEPGYICKLCRARGNTNELIAHLTSDEHRLKYFEKKHPSIYFALTAGQTSGTSNQKSVLQALAIKQHAQVMERTEGRARISQRLTTLVDPGPYGLRRCGAQKISPTYYPAVQPAVLPILTHGLASYGSATFGITKNIFPTTRPTSDDMLPPGVSLDERTSATSTERVVVPHPSLLPPGVSADDRVTSNVKSGQKGGVYEQKLWSVQCDRFLAKLSGDPQKGTVSAKASSNSSKIDGKPNLELRKKDAKIDGGKSGAKASKEDPKSDVANKSSKSSSDRRRRSSSRDRSRERSSQRRHRSKSRSRSRSRSSSRSDRRSKSDKKSSDKEKTKRRSKSPAKGKRSRERSPSHESPKKKVRQDKESPSKSKSSGQSLELAELLTKVAQQLSSASSAKPKPEPELAPSTGAIGALLSKLLADKVKAPATPAVPTTAAVGGGAGQLLAMLGKRKPEAPVAPKITSTPMGDMEKLMKFIAEEEEKKRRQEEQNNAIMALLSAKPPTSKASTAGPTVIEYGHGSRQQQPGHVVPATKPSTSQVGGQTGGNWMTDSSHMDGIDELVALATRNVQRAQMNSAPSHANAARAIRPPTVPGPPPPIIPFDVSRPPPIRPPPPLSFGNPRRPVPAPFLQQPADNAQAAAIVNAAAAVLLSTIFNQQMPSRG